MGNLSSLGLVPGKVEQAEFNFDPAPEGKYKCLISKCEIKGKKDNSGNYINCELTIANGDYAGRKIFHVFSVWSTNESARKVANYMISTLWDAAGLGPLKDTSEIVDQVVIVDLKVEKEKRDKVLTGKLVNVVKAFLKKGAAPANAPSAQAPARATAKAPAPATEETDEDMPF